MVRIGGLGPRSFSGECVLGEDENDTRRRSGGHTSGANGKNKAGSTFSSLQLLLPTAHGGESTAANGSFMWWGCCMSGSGSEGVLHGGWCGGGEFLRGTASEKTFPPEDVLLLSPTAEGEVRPCFPPLRGSDPVPGGERSAAEEEIVLTGADEIVLTGAEEEPAGRTGGGDRSCAADKPTGTETSVGFSGESRQTVARGETHRATTDGLLVENRFALPAKSAAVARSAVGGVTYGVARGTELCTFVGTGTTGGTGTFVPAGAGTGLLEEIRTSERPMLEHPMLEELRASERPMLLHPMELRTRDVGGAPVHPMLEELRASDASEHSQPAPPKCGGEKTTMFSTLANAVMRKASLLKSNRSREPSREKRRGSPLSCVRKPAVGVRTTTRSSALVSAGEKAEARIAGAAGTRPNSRGDSPTPRMVREVKWDEHTAPTMIPRTFPHHEPAHQAGPDLVSPVGTGPTAAVPGASLREEDAAPHFHQTLRSDPAAQPVSAKPQLEFMAKEYREHSPPEDMLCTGRAGPQATDRKEVCGEDKLCYPSDKGTWTTRGVWVYVF